MSSETMCSHCGEAPAVTLRIAKEEPDLDGNGVAWSETQAILDDNDTQEDNDFYVIETFCSKSCIHLAGEFKHAMGRDD